MYEVVYEGKLNKLQPLSGGILGHVACLNDGRAHTLSIEYTQSSQFTVSVEL